MDHPKTEHGVIIPHGILSPEALRGLVEEFVTRHGTDGGYTRRTLRENVDVVMAQLRKGEAIIVYDDITQTANIIPQQ